MRDGDVGGLWARSFECEMVVMLFLPEKRLSEDCRSQDCKRIAGVKHAEVCSIKCVKSKLDTWKLQKSLSIEAFTKQATEDLKAGKPMWGGIVFFTSSLKQLIEASLEGEPGTHLADTRTKPH